MNNKKKFDWNYKKVWTNNSVQPTSTIVQAEFSNKNGGFSKVLLRVDVRRSSVEPAASEQHLHQQQAWQPPQHRFRQLREDVGPKNLFRRKNIVLHQRVRRSHDALLKVLLFYGKNLKEFYVAPICYS